MGEGKKSWNTEIVVALITVVGSVGTAGLSEILSEDDDKGKKSKTEFVYSVQALTSEAGKTISVSKAEVVLEIPGRSPLRKKTDGKGMARLAVDEALKGKQAELFIQKKGYQPFKNEVDLVEQLPYKVKLEPKSPFDTEQPVLTETETEAEDKERKLPFFKRNYLKKGSKKEGKLGKGSAHTYNIEGQKNQPVVLRVKGTGSLNYVVKLLDKHEKLLTKKGPFKQGEQTITYIPKNDEVIKITVEGTKRSGYYTLEIL